MGLYELLKEGSKKLSIKISDRDIEALLTYKDILLEWNKKINLTAIIEEEDIVIKHFLDSLSCMGVGQLKDRGKMIDVGTGAGFPGIPLKLLLPNIELTLLDSLKKRVNFLREVVGQLGLEGVRCLHGRAEDYGRKEGYRDCYDYAVARAVAPLNVLVEYCMPFVKPGGYFICQKGINLEEELAEAQRAIGLLGAKIVDKKRIELPFSEITHSILVLEKTRESPTKYPRRPGRPTKNPIK